MTTPRVDELVTVPRRGACPTCARPVTQPGGRGRTRIYCSDRCRYRAKNGARDLRGSSPPAWQIEALRAGWGPISPT